MNNWEYWKEKGHPVVSVGKIICSSRKTRHSISDQKTSNMTEICLKTILLNRFHITELFMELHNCCGISSHYDIKQESSMRWSIDSKIKKVH